VQQCGEARHGAAGQGVARHGKHTASHGVQQFGAAWHGAAGQGAARRGKANTQHPCGGAEVCLQHNKN